MSSTTCETCRYNVNYLCRCTFSPFNGMANRYSYPGLNTMVKPNEDFRYFSACECFSETPTPHTTSTILYQCQECKHSRNHYIYKNEEYDCFETVSNVWGRDFNNSKPEPINVKLVCTLGQSPRYNQNITGFKSTCSYFSEGPYELKQEQPPNPEPTLTRRMLMII